MSLENLVRAAGNYQHGQRHGNRYISEFLSLRSAPDILNAVNPLGKRAEKEITESMAMMQRMRDIFLLAPEKYTLYDLCAGNALTSVIAAHLLPVKEAIAIDKKPRERNWQAVRKFRYSVIDIKQIPADFFSEDSVIISVHPCRAVASKVVDLYKESRAEHLVLMPCCVGGVEKRYKFVASLLSEYYAWALQLADSAGGTVTVDKSILSPCNAVITAKK